MIVGILSLPAYLHKDSLGVLMLQFCIEKIRANQIDVSTLASTPRLHQCFKLYMLHTVKLESLANEQCFIKLNSTIIFYTV